MNWKDIIQVIFYIVGILFFLVVIMAAFIFIRRTTQTANTIKKVITSSNVEDLIMKVKDNVSPIIKLINNGRA